MSAKFFIDTNVLLYAYHSQSKEKHSVAKSLLIDLWANRTGVLSPQVLQEFYVIATRKLAEPLTRASAKYVVEKYSRWCIDATAADVTTAIQIEEASRISLWDALILASARKAGAEVVLSEDMNHGQMLARIRIENPFLAG